MEHRITEIKPVSAELCDVNDVTRYPSAAVTLKSENHQILLDSDFYDVIENFFHDDDEFDFGSPQVAMPVMDVCEGTSVPTIAAEPVPCYPCHEGVDIRMGMGYGADEGVRMGVTRCASTSAMHQVESESVFEVKPMAKPMQYPACGIELKAVTDPPYSQCQSEQFHCTTASVTAMTSAKFPLPRANSYVDTTTAATYPSKFQPRITPLSSTPASLSKEEKRSMRHKATLRWREKIAKAKQKSKLGEPHAVSARKAATAKRQRENGRFKKVSTAWISVSEFQNKCNINGTGTYSSGTNTDSQVLISTEKAAAIQIYDHADAKSEYPLFIKDEAIA